MPLNQLIILFVFSTAELMQTRKQFFVGQCIAIFCKKQHSYNIPIYRTYLLLETRGGGGQQLALTGEGGWVAPAAKHARKRRERSGTRVWLFMLELSISRFRLPLLKRKMLFFSLISFHSFSQRKAAIGCISKIITSVHFAYYRLQF